MGKLVEELKKNKYLDKQPREERIKELLDKVIEDHNDTLKRLVDTKEKEKNDYTANSS